MKRKYAIAMLLNSYVPQEVKVIQDRIKGRLGISDRTWSRWLNLTEDETYKLRPHTLQVIAEELKVSAQELTVNTEAEEV